MNKVLLAKHAWRALRQPTQPWVQVLHSKYGQLMDPNICQKKVGGSLIWSGLRVGFDLMRMGVRKDEAEWRRGESWWMHSMKGFFTAKSAYEMMDPNPQDKNFR